LLLSTLRRYVEAMGGQLELVAHFPNRSPLVIEQLATKAPARTEPGRAGRRDEAQNASRPAPPNRGPNPALKLFVLRCPRLSAN
jgi:hypothetical protein